MRSGFMKIGPLLAISFIVSVWVATNYASNNIDKINTWIETHAPSLSPLIADRYVNSLMGIPYAVDIAVWPETLTMTVGEQVQFVAAVMYSDGSIWCSDGVFNDTFPGDTIGDRLGPQPWTLDAACRSAAMLLDTVIVQDTTLRAIRLMWSNQANAERLIITGADTTRLPYDSVKYNIQIRSPDLIVFDSTFADTVFVWQAGTPGQQYFARGVACGHLGGTISCTAEGEEMQIIFPYPRIESTTLIPMLLLADTVELP